MISYYRTANTVSPYPKLPCGKCVYSYSLSTLDSAPCAFQHKAVVFNLLALWVRSCRQGQSWARLSVGLVHGVRCNLAHWPGCSHGVTSCSTLIWHLGAVIWLIRLSTGVEICWRGAVVLIVPCNFLQLLWQLMLPPLPQCQTSRPMGSPSDWRLSTTDISRDLSNSQQN